MKLSIYTYRFYFVLSCILLLFWGIFMRLFYLSTKNREFLEDKADRRIVKTIEIGIHRGIIYDRNMNILAISMPVESVFINPKIFKPTIDKEKQLAKELHLSLKELRAKDDKKRGFVYLKKQISPSEADKVRALKIDGVFFERSYKRFYPEGEITAHVVGFTNANDEGQEGIELFYNNYLKGTPTKIKAIKDQKGNIISFIKNQEEKGKDGNDLVLSIDKRIQYKAYYELQKTILKYKADSGSVIVLNPKTGEILAMVNMPSYNPNNRQNIQSRQIRNRAITDLFEPGSTIKTFSVATLLKSKHFTKNSIIDTNPGFFYVSGNKITDENINNGQLTLTEVLQKSSNIGIAKSILSLKDHSSLIDTLYDFGFGEKTQVEFPGEVSGYIEDMKTFRPFVLATLSFGYAMSTTALQLTRAYGIIANYGLKVQPTLVKVNNPKAITSTRVISPKIARDLMEMLEKVTKLGGTALKARIYGIDVGGKTGTARIAGKHGYKDKKYVSSFVGMAPLWGKGPKLVVAVVINNPRQQDYGGLVAAPLFSTIMEYALRFCDN